MHGWFSIFILVWMGVYRHAPYSPPTKEGFEILGYRIVSVDSTVLGAPEVGKIQV